MIEGSKSRREQQALLDFQLRADRGTYLHLPMWLLIAGSIRLDRSAAAVFWINGALMLVTALARRRFYGRFERLLDRWPRVARTAGRVAIAIPALHWSLLTAASVRDGVLHPLTIPFMFIVVGMATAGTMVLAIDRMVRLYYPLVLMLPFNLALLFRSGGSGGLIPIMSVGVILYVLSATRLVHGSYWDAFAAQSALEERAEDLELLSTTDALTQIPSDEWAMLINEADRALYLAKDQGRNRVIAVAA